MIAVIKGDIIASRKLDNQEIWINPLKKILGKWGKSPQQWELVWGDFFQVEIPEPEGALKKALEIKALIKKTQSRDKENKIHTLDVRISIGFGQKTYSGKKISESNGPAFINAGEKFDELKKGSVTMGIKSPWPEFDEEFNLYLKLADTIMDRWSASSAELMAIALHNPNFTQEEIGKKLGIKQSGVSGRWNRACINEIFAIINAYDKKIKPLLS